MRSSHSRLATAIIAGLFIAAACTSAGTPDPTTSTASASTPVPTPVGPTASPEPSRTPLVAIDPSGTGDWHLLPDPVGLGTGIVLRVIAVPDGFVALGCTALADIGCDVPALWASPDAQTWSGPILLPTVSGELQGDAMAAAVTPAGIAIGGSVVRNDQVHAALWFSPDGRSFERVAGAASFVGARVGDLTSAGGRFVAVGTLAPYGGEWYGFRAWSSDDGRTWVDRTPADPGEAFPIGLLAVTGGLVAWGQSCTVCVPAAAWWRSLDGLTWTATGNELAPDGSNVEVVGERDGGLVAFGTIGGRDEPILPAAWSRDTGGDRWEPAQPPAHQEGTSVTQHLRIGHGAVLAGQTSVDGQPVGLIWLAGPGEEVWRPPVQLPGMSVKELLQDPAQLDRLVVVALSVEGDLRRIVVWTGTVDWAVQP